MPRSNAEVTAAAGPSYITWPSRRATTRLQYFRAKSTWCSDTTTVTLSLRLMSASVSMTLREDSGSSEAIGRSEEHTSELQSLMRISYAVFCLKKKKPETNTPHSNY